MKRRTFFNHTLSFSLALSALPFAKVFSKSPKMSGEFPRRKLGKTGERLSIIGFGGIMVSNQEQSYANDLVAKSYDTGINYYDVAPTYGNAEEKLGPALEPYRKKCFLACKTTERKSEGAAKELHQSLKNLRTDYFDLYQLHALSSVEDVETAFGPGGAMELFLKAKQEGKVRFLGFSAHSEEAALLAMSRFDFDTVLYPINYVCWFQGNFGRGVVQMAKEKGMGILALKSFAHRPIPQGAEKPYERLWYVPIEDEDIQDLSLRFTLSQGVTAAIPPGDPFFFPKALNIAQGPVTLSSAELKKIESLSSEVNPLFSA
jgi:predicted aldo/keto reductase-like oxidoreductase